MQMWHLFTPSSRSSGYSVSSNLQQDHSLDPSGMNYVFKCSNASKTLQCGEVQSCFAGKLTAKLLQCQSRVSL